MEAHLWAGNVPLRPMRHVQEDHQMKHKLILIGGVIASAVVSITLMWGVWTGIFWMMENT
jgi:hypothetical protein